MNWPRLLIPVLLLAGIPAPTAAAPDEVRERYVRALRIHLAGDSQTAIAQLAELADVAPASIPVHRALALLALEQGEETATTWSKAFRKRLRRTRRDVGASVGRALILEAYGRQREAHNLLLSAVMAGARSPLLADPLCRTSPDPPGLHQWMSARARAIGRDPDFAALRVETLLACNQPATAGEVLATAITRYPLSRRLLALQADRLRADGRFRQAGAAAALAVGLPGMVPVPEVRIPRRLALARALIAAQRPEQARGVLATLGPIVAPDGEERLEAMTEVARAELELARGRPIRALQRLPDHPVLPAAWKATARAVEARARAGLGLPVAAPKDDPEAPALALADQGVALALAAVSRSHQDHAATIVPRLVPLIARLAQAGLPHRAALLELALAARAGEAEGKQLLDKALERLPRSGDARLETGARIVEASWALGRGDPAAAQASCRLDPRTAAATPGRLLAALHLTAARAALARGDEAGASEAVAEGLLDLQEADLARILTPDELRPLEELQGRPALTLPGVGLAADLAAGHPVPAATSRLLANLTRTSRSWSVLDRSWGDSPTEISRSLSPGACLVLATDDDEAPWITVGSEGITAATPPGPAFLSRPPCARATVLYWAGPAAAPAGLSWPDRPELLLVRVVRPVALPRGSVEEVVARRPWKVVGPGPDRPLRRLVENLAGVPTDRDTPAAPRGEEYWSLYTGAGMVPRRWPLATGWLTPPAARGEPGWMEIEALGQQARDPGIEDGLVVVGLRAGAHRLGLRVLAEAALDSPRRYALLSVEPLSSEQIQQLAEVLPAWNRSPLAGAARLAADNPELASRLTLWTAPGRLPLPRRWNWTWPLLLAAIAAAVGGGLYHWRRRRRMR